MFEYGAMPKTLAQLHVGMRERLPVPTARKFWREPLSEALNALGEFEQFWFDLSEMRRSRLGVGLSEGGRDAAEMQVREDLDGESTI